MLPVVTPEVRAVFDRLLASEQEIAEARRQQNMDPLFNAAEDAGMTDAEFASYRAAVDAARQEAEEAHAAEYMAELTRTQQAWWREEREQVRAEVEAETNAMPVYVALAALQGGTLPTGVKLPEGVQPFKLDRQAIVNAYGEDVLKQLPRPYVYAKTGGVAPDVAATMLGWTSADDLIMALVNAKPRRAYIEAETDRRMLERHGDMRTDGTAAERAMQAVHGDRQAELLITEMRKLAGRAERRVAPVDILREQARRQIAGKRIREIRPGVYQAATAQAAQKALEFAAQGDFAAAFVEKQRQLYNLYLFREATKAREVVEQTVAYMRTFDKPATRQRIGKAGADYLEQIDAILERYEFRTVPLRQLDRRHSLAAWVAAREAANGPVDIDERLLAETKQRNYKDVTLEELTGVRDAVKNIESLVRLKNHLIKVQADRELSEAVDEIVRTIEAHSKGARPQQVGELTGAAQVGKLLSGWFANHRKAASIVRQMDGFKDGGPLWNLLIRPLNEAADAEAVMGEQATVRLGEIFKAYSWAENRAMHRKVFRQIVGRRLSKWDIIMMALNWGNEDNRQRLLDGFGWGEFQVQQLLDTLDHRDWRFVQAVWDFLDGYWPAIEAKQRRVFGVAPEKVQAEPVETKFGTFSGGYFPLKYADVQAAQHTTKDAADILSRGAVTKATTRRGHTKERLQQVERPVRLEIGVLFEHVTQVIHDLTHHETLIDLNRLVGHRGVREAVERHYGAEAYHQIAGVLRDVAAGDMPATNVFQQSITWLRQGVSISAMGWNVGTVLMQPLGLTQSIVRVGPVWVARGLRTWLASWATRESVVEQIYQQSEFMRLRGKTQQREIREVRSNVQAGASMIPMPPAIRESYFLLIAKAQMLVDVPTWLGAYEKAVASGVEEAAAVKLADQAVIDSQGSGHIKDLAEIQRGGPLQKIFTAFYSFFNTTLNLTIESVARTNPRSAVSIGRLAVDMLLLYTAPALLGAAIREAVFGGDDDDDERWLLWAFKHQLAYLANTMMGTREIAGFFEGFYDYKGPSGVRAYAVIGDLMRQTFQGEIDANLISAANEAGGIFFHYPSTAIRRAIGGLHHWATDEDGSPLDVISGRPRE